MPAILLSLVLGIPSTALAYWTTGGAGTGGGISGSLLAPVASAVRTVGTNTIVVSWSLPSNSGAATGFHVQRAPAESSAWVDVCGTDAAPIFGASCSDAVTTSGSWKYRVIAHKGGWRASSDQTAAIATDTSRLTVTVDQASTQSDPTSTQPVNFTVVFIKPVTGLTAGGIRFSREATLTGTPAFSVTGSGTTYNIAVSGLQSTTPTGGALSLQLFENAAVDDYGNRSAPSTSTDNTVRLDMTPPGAPVSAPRLTTDSGIASRPETLSDNRTNVAKLGFAQNTAVPADANGGTVRLYRATSATAAGAVVGTASIANGAYAVTESSDAPATADGIYYYYVQYIDALGNVGDLAAAADPSRRLAVTIDRTAPSVSMEYTRQLATLIPLQLGTVTTSGTASQGATDVQQVAVRICPGTSMNCTNATLGVASVGATTGAYTFTTSNLLGGILQTSVAQISQTDLAGNVGYSSVRSLPGLL